MNSETSKTKFLYQLRQYGLRKFFISLDFIIATSVLITASLDNYYKLHIFSSGNGGYVVEIFATASTLFAITLAALAILLSFSGGEFVGFLRKNNKLFPLLFPFWIGSVAYLIVIVLSVLYLILHSETFNLFKGYLYPFIISIFTYGIINTFYLLATVIRFGYFLDIYEKFKNDKN